MTEGQLRARLIPWQRMRKSQGVEFWTVSACGRMRFIGSIARIVQ